MMIDSRVHVSLHPHWPNQSSDLKTFCPPCYEKTVWCFSKANSDHIERAVIVMSKFPFLMVQSQIFSQILFLTQ